MQDFLKGRRTEIEMINGFIVKQFERLGRTAPYNAAIMEVGAMISKGEINPKPENIDLLRNVIKKNLN